VSERSRRLCVWQGQQAVAVSETGIPGIERCEARNNPAKLTPANNANATGHVTRWRYPKGSTTGGKPMKTLILLTNIEVATLPGIEPGLPP
jgi:hypothetical protein